MKKRRIGFNAYQDEEENREQEPDFFEKIRTKNLDSIKKIVSERYDPAGNVHDCEFRTTMELKYELQEMISVSESSLNDALNEMQFRLQYIDDRPHWVLYRKSSGIPE
jgi:hypothetical protein